MTQMIAITTIPLFAILLGVTHELIELVFGEKWLPSVKVLQIILLFGFIRSIFAPSGRIFLILKKPHLLIYANLVQLPLLISGVWFGVKNLEILGAGIAVASVLSIGGFIYIFMVSKLLNMNILEFLNQIFPGLFCISFSLLTAWLFKIWMFHVGLSSFLIVILYLPVLLSLYGLLLFIFFRDLSITITNWMVGLFYTMLKLILEVLGISNHAFVQNLLQRSKK